MTFAGRVEVSQNVTVQMKAQEISEFLRARIKEGELMKGARLPPFREICSRWSVSRTTVMKAVGTLEHEGLVRRVQRGGVYVGGDEDRGASQQAGPRLRRSKPGLVAEQIAGDISRGHFRAGQRLPLMKALRHRYSSSPRTVSAALKIVQSDGVIRPSGLGYIVGQTTAAGRTTPQVVEFIDTSIIVRSLHAVEENMVAFFRSFEEELGKAGITFSFNEAGDMRARSSARAAGLAGLFRSMSQADTPAGVFREVSSISRKHLPVVLYDCYELRRHHVVTKSIVPDNAFPFVGLHERDCEAAGVHLAASGHLEVAFISAFEGDWVRRLLRGFERGLRSAGGERAAVRPFVLDHKIRSFRHSIGVSDLWMREQNRVYAAATRSAFRNIEVNDDGDVYPISIHAYWWALGQSVKYTLAPVFEEALRGSGGRRATAWVCSTPHSAVAAREFLQKAKTDGAREISVLSLGDNYQTLINRISALDFQHALKGYLAAHCIIGDIPIKKDRQGIVDCPVRIIDRGSVAPRSPRPGQSARTLPSSFESVGLLRRKYSQTVEPPSPACPSREAESRRRSWVR